MKKESYVQTQSGLIVPEHVVCKPKRPIAFDFFSGGGGFGLGIMEAGFEIIGASEFCAEAALTYLCNLGSYPVNIHFIDGEKDKARFNKAAEREYKKMFKSSVIPQTFSSGSGWISKHPDCSGVKNFWFGDIRKLTGKQILETLGLRRGDIDLVFGGPPCQGFSRSGKQTVGDPRNNLVYEYARMIVELSPKTFIMEEVPDVLNFYDPDGVPVLDKFCMMLEDGGFGKWDMIKKSLLMQSGAGAVIKDGLSRHKKTKAKKEKQDKKQGSLFGDLV